MRESSKRPSMAFVFFTREGAPLGVADAEAEPSRRRQRRWSRCADRDLRETVNPVTTSVRDAWARLRELADEVRTTRDDLKGHRLRLVDGKQRARCTPRRRCCCGPARGWWTWPSPGRCTVATGPGRRGDGLLYMLFADGMLQGQSLGKKMFGVKVDLPADPERRAAPRQRAAQRAPSGS